PLFDMNRKEIGGMKQHAKQPAELRGLIVRQNAVGDGHGGVEERGEARALASEIVARGGEASVSKLTGQAEIQGREKPGAHHRAQRGARIGAPGEARVNDEALRKTSATLRGWHRGKMA